LSGDKALDPELAVEDGEPVRQTEEAAAVGSEAADAVSSNLEPKGAVLDVRHDHGVPCAGVLGDGRPLGPAADRRRRRRALAPPRRHLA
jgi:hypothetical protein